MTETGLDIDLTLPSRDVENSLNDTEATKQPRWCDGHDAMEQADWKSQESKENPVEHEFQFDHCDKSPSKRDYVGTNPSQRTRRNTIAGALLGGSCSRKLIMLMLVALTSIILSVLFGSSSASARGSKLPYADDSLIERRRNIETELLKQKVSLEADLKNTNSPQYNALQWIASQDPAQLSPTDPALLERFALSVLFFSNDGHLVDDDNKHHPAANWQNHDSWLKTSNVCEWYGITCVQDGDSNSVQALNLTHNGLGGTIPSELFALSRLTVFELSYNDMVGTLPDIIFQTLTSLTFVRVRYNQLSGTIPSELVGITSLTDIHLCGNRLTGELPPQINQASQLTSLSIPGNKLSGRIPNLDHLKSIQSVFLDQNRLSGEIPSSIAKLTSLINLSLRGNQLSGTVPSNWNRLINLETLHLDDNALTGTVPDYFEKWSGLTEFHIFKNHLEGTIHSSIGTLGALTSLQVQMNNFMGQIPTTMGLLTNLETLSMEGNKFTGTIPDVFYDMAHLRDLRLQNNRFTGTIPSSLANCNNLTHLLLGSNALTGGVPATFGNLLELQQMNIESNHLSGDMPDEVCDLVSAGSLGLLRANCATGSMMNCSCCRCF